MTDQQERPAKREAYKLLLSHLKYHSGIVGGGQLSAACTTLILHIMHHMIISNDNRQEIHDELQNIADECTNPALSADIKNLAEQILRETWTEETYILVFEDNQQELVYPTLYTDKEEAEDARDKWNADIPACAIRAARVVPI